MPTVKQFSDVLSEWTGVLMRHSTRDINRFMKEYGFSMPQFHTMMRLYYRETCGVSDIADDVGFTKAASSQMIDRLVQQGLLTRTENPDDRRERQIALAEKGKKLIEEIVSARHRWMENLTTTLSSEEQQAIVDALILLTQAAKRLEQEERR
jgi:DNA-binding MarR family transcriptional regulator